eukprot:6425855-Amphidinium_carterae.1
MADTAACSLKMTLWQCIPTEVQKESYSPLVLNMSKLALKSPCCLVEPVGLEHMSQEFIKELGALEPGK